MDGGWGQEAPLPIICHTYSTMMKLSIVIHSYTLPKEDPKNIYIM